MRTPTDPVFVETLPRGPVRDKYKLFVYNASTESHWRGGFGTAKTTALVQRHGLMRLKYPGSPGLIARSSLTVFNRTTLRNFLEMWGAFGEYKKMDARFEWHNGSISDFFGLDVPNVQDALKSYEPLDVCVDEADEIGEDIYAMAKGRARWQPKGELLEHYLALGLTCWETDPEGIRRLVMPHRTSSISNFNGRDWVYYRFKHERHSDPVVGARLYVEATTDENHSLPAGYVEGLRAEKGEEFVKRFVYGDDGVAFGRILHKFSQANVFEPASIPAHWPLYVGVDVGFGHPTAGLIARVGDDGRVWVTHEYLQAERVALENAQAIKALCGTVAPTATYGSPDAARRDPTSGRSPADDYRKAGLNIIPAATRHDESSDLVNAMLRPLSTRPGADVEPRLMISSACRTLVRQIEGMTWEKRRKKARGSDSGNLEDDLYDCLRMLVTGLPEGVRAEQENLVSNRPRVERKRLGGY